MNIGFGNVVPSDRIISIIQPDSAPTKRLIQQFRERKLVIDATNGRKTRSMILLDSQHIVLSAVQPETISQRLTED